MIESDPNRMHKILKKLRWANLLQWLSQLLQTGLFFFLIQQVAMHSDETSLAQANHFLVSASLFLSLFHLGRRVLRWIIDNVFADRQRYFSFQNTIERENMRMGGGFSYLYNQARHSPFPRLYQNASLAFLIFYSLYLIPPLLMALLGQKMQAESWLIKLILLNILFYFLAHNLQNRLAKWSKRTHAKIWDSKYQDRWLFNLKELELYHENFIKLEKRWSGHLRQAYYRNGVYHNQAHFYFVTLILYDKKLKQVQKLIYYADENYQDLSHGPQALLNTRQGKYIRQESSLPDWYLPAKEKSWLRIPILAYKILVFLLVMRFDLYFQYQDSAFYTSLVLIFIIPTLLEMLRINLEDQAYAKKKLSQKKP